MSKIRYLIVDDGSNWVVKCAASLRWKDAGGPFGTLDEAARFVKAKLAGCTCKAVSNIQSSTHVRGCKLRFDPTTWC